MPPEPFPLPLPLARPPPSYRRRGGGGLSKHSPRRRRQPGRPVAHGRACCRIKRRAMPSRPGRRCSRGAVWLNCGCVSCDDGLCRRARRPGARELPRQMLGSLMSPPSRTPSAVVNSRADACPWEREALALQQQRQHRNKWRQPLSTAAAATRDSERLRALVAGGRPAFGPVQIFGTMVVPHDIATRHLADPTAAGYRGIGSAHAPPSGPPHAWLPRVLRRRAIRRRAMRDTATRDTATRLNRSPGEETRRGLEAAPPRQGRP